MSNATVHVIRKSAADAITYISEMLLLQLLPLLLLILLMFDAVVVVVVCDYAAVFSATGVGASSSAFAAAALMLLPLMLLPFRRYPCCSCPPCCCIIRCYPGRSQIYLNPSPFLSLLCNRRQPACRTVINALPGGGGLIHITSCILEEN